jgi:hypothetical protein
MKPIFYLWDYTWEPGLLISEGTRNFKVRMRWQNGFRDRYFPKEKCAFPDERVCIVWEMWRGTNGRGGYRVERTLYESQQTLASSVGRDMCGPGRLTESSMGVLNK